MASFFGRNPDNSVGASKGFMFGPSKRDYLDNTLMSSNRTYAQVTEINKAPSGVAKKVSPLRRTEADEFDFNDLGGSRVSKLNRIDEEA
jgi:hypothetical protein